MMFGKPNSTVCVVSDRPLIRRRPIRGHRGRTSLHVYVGPLSIDIWSWRKPMIHWDRTGNWKAV